MEHRIRVCVAAIGIAAIGHQAQGFNWFFDSSEDSANFEFAFRSGNGAEEFNAIGIEMLSELDPGDNLFGGLPEGVTISGEPAVGSVPFPDPAFADLSEPSGSWSNVDPSGLPPEPERAAAFGDTFARIDPANELTFNIDFESLSDEDRFAFAFFMFQEGEEASQNEFVFIINVFQQPSGTFSARQSYLTSETRTRSDFGMSVIPMPHPAGMACVGLAGVAMVRRRRSV